MTVSLPPRRATPNEFLETLGNSPVRARGTRCLRAPLSLFRPVVDRPGDENGIRNAIIASHDDNHGSLSPISIYRDRGRDSARFKRIPSFIVRRINVSWYSLELMSDQRSV